jgi:hypothetical protein
VIALGSLGGANLIVTICAIAVLAALVVRNRVRRSKFHPSEGRASFSQRGGTRLRLLRDGRSRILLDSHGKTFGIARVQLGNANVLVDVVVGTTRYVPVQEKVPASVVAADPGFPSEDFDRLVARHLTGLWKIQHRHEDPKQHLDLFSVRWIAAETNETLLRILGRNFERKANAQIQRKDGRWLHFPVEGGTPDVAVMSAVTLDGSTIARYRFTPCANALDRLRVMAFLIFGLLPMQPIEIVVEPFVEISDELSLALIVSAFELTGYFCQSGGG